MKLKSFFAVACFLPDRAKDLSAPMYCLGTCLKFSSTRLFEHKTFREEKRKGILLPEELLSACL